MARARPFADRLGPSMPFVVLAVLVVASFLFGGGARDDLLSLAILRPLGALALIYGLYGLRWEDVREFRGPLLLFGAVLLLIGLHLVPLPPSIWSALPGREIAVEAGEMAGIAQPWRPIALVPWRAWNAFFAMLIPAAALVLAIRCRPDQRAAIVPVVLGCGIVSVVFGILQAVSGYREGLYLYSITNVGSPTGLFANRNHHAAMICAFLPLLAMFAGSARSPEAKRIYPWLASVAGGVMLLLLLITGSRAGLLLSLPALVFVALVYRPPAKRVGTRLFPLALLLAGALLVALLAATFLEIGGLERLLRFESAEERRLQSWPVIVDLVWQYFPVGSGIGSFVEVYMIAEPRDLLGPSYLNHAHNDFLEWALEGGLAAIALIVAAVVSWAIRSMKLLRGRQRRETDGLALAGSAIILILGLASVGDYPLRVPSLGVVAAIAVVWLVGSRAGKAGSASIANAPRNVAS